MLPVQIDLSEIVDEFALTAEQAQGLGESIIDRIVVDYMHKWNDTVNGGLKQLRSLYQRAMYVERNSPTEVVFGLAPGEDGLALAIEEGKPPFDMKEGFSHSSKRKTSLGGGWYLTIPFRYATSQAVAESTIFSGKLPAEIERIAKENDGKPVRAIQLPSQYAQLGRRKAIQGADGVIPEYVHKAPKFQGLVRVDVSSTRNENRGAYMTFRRVSNNSEPYSWIHPGFEARKFMDKALDQTQISQVVDMALDKFLSQI